MPRPASVGPGIRGAIGWIARKLVCLLRLLSNAGRKDPRDACRAAPAGDRPTIGASGVANVLAYLTPRRRCESGP
jgi:hypothetical protein